MLRSFCRPASLDAKQRFRMENGLAVRAVASGLANLRIDASIIFYTNKTPPKPNNNEIQVDGPERSSAAGLGAASTPTTMHTYTHGTIPGYYTTGLARATQRQGHNGAGTSRSRHVHFEPSRPGWDTTPISTTG